MTLKRFIGIILCIPWMMYFITAMAGVVLDIAAAARRAFIETYLWHGAEVFWTGKEYQVYQVAILWGFLGLFIIGLWLQKRKMDLEAMSVSRNALESVACNLQFAFVWNSSPKGFRYWKKVDYELERILTAVREEDAKRKS